MHAQVTSVFHLNCTKKIHRNNVEFSSIEISSKKLHRNDVAILIIEVTLNKVCQNDVDFRRNIDIESVSIRLGVPVA